MNTLIFLLILFSCSHKAKRKNGEEDVHVYSHKLFLMSRAPPMDFAAHQNEWNYELSLRFFAPEFNHIFLVCDIGFMM